jgi:hypothetical protein
MTLIFIGLYSFEHPQICAVKRGHGNASGQVGRREHFRLSSARTGQTGSAPRHQPAQRRVRVAIRRFDRNDGDRIHMEEFAQILVQYPADKYRSANYQQIAKTLYNHTEDG